jgi:diguanylate cyclase (GGDEF)-like protein
MARTGGLKRLLDSLTGRMVLGILGIYAVLTPLLFYGLLYIVRQGYEDQFVHHARSDAAAFARLLAPQLRDARLQGVLDEAVASGRLVFAEIVDANGTPLAHADAADKPRVFSEDFLFGQHDDTTYQISLPVDPEAREPGPIVRVGYDETLTNERVAAANRRGLYVGTTFLLVTLGFAAFAAPRITRPLQQLQETAQQIARGDLDTELQVESSLIELRGLAHDLNMMRAELALQATELEHRALHDTLTSLPNRALLHDRVRQAMRLGARTGQQLALLLLDLDSFKEINDTLGHAVGDVVLQEVAQRLRSVARESDTVSRLGGDEFAVLLPNTGSREALAFAIRLAAAIGKEIATEHNTLAVGTSIGIALFPKHGQNFNTLLRRADVALYAAKRARGGCMLYRSELERGEMQRLTLSTELRKALENGEFVLHYQPLVSASTGETHSAEALMRWRHPERGLLPASTFIPHAERMGLIHKLTDWALEESVRQCRAWQERGLDTRIAVNLSPLCLRDERLTQRVAAMLRRHDLSPTRLVIEVTESAVLDDPAKTHRILEALRSLGVRLSLDDFGTGYASLTHLRNLPVDEVKIDRSFVRNLPGDNTSAAIVQAVVTLAHNLELQVVGEGVEHELALTVMRRMGCDVLQGHFISPALPADDFVRWCHANAGRGSQARG